MVMGESVHWEKKVIAGHLVGRGGLALEAKRKLSGMMTMMQSSGGQYSLGCRVDCIVRSCYVLHQTPADLLLSGLGGP
jgi:hypothetical protein